MKTLAAVSLLFCSSVAVAASSVETLMFIEQHAASKDYEYENCAKYIELVSTMAIASATFRVTLTKESPMNKLEDRLNRVVKIEQHVQSCQLFNSLKDQTRAVENLLQKEHETDKRWCLGEFLFVDATFDRILEAQMAGYYLKFGRADPETCASTRATILKNEGEAAALDFDEGVKAAEARWQQHLEEIANRHIREEDARLREVYGVDCKLTDYACVFKAGGVINIMRNKRRLNRGN